MPDKYTEARIREARLIVARPEEVLADLEKYGDELKKSMFRGDEHLEKSLLARREPLIDLGLARYARQKEVVAALYQKSLATPVDHLQERYLRGLRIACLSNEVVKSLASQFPKDMLGKEEFARLTTEGDEEDLAALLSNPNLADQVLEGLYKNEGLFALLPDERRRLLVHLSIDNPRLITNKDSFDGPDLGYMGIHRAIITMLASAPTTEEWLITLRELLDRLDPGNVGSPHESITSILERWAQVPVPKKSLFKEGYFTALSMRDEFRCLVAAMYGRYYYHGKDDKFTSSILGRADSLDVVVRCAYYGKAKLTDKDMKEGFARDEDVYLFAVLCNECVYTPSLRRLLEDQQRSAGADLEHVYRCRCEQIHKRRPSFDPRPLSEWDADKEEDAEKHATQRKKIKWLIAILCLIGIAMISRVP